MDVDSKFSNLLSISYWNNFSFNINELSLSSSFNFHSTIFKWKKVCVIEKPQTFWKRLRFFLS